MIKCPFCHFENEDGALFCEQCKSDLTGVESTYDTPREAPPMAEAIPMAAPMAETVPLMAEPFAAEAIVAEAVPLAEAHALNIPMAEIPSAAAIPMAEMPPMAAPLEAYPLETAPPMAPLVAEPIVAAPLAEFAPPPEPASAPPPPEPAPIAATPPPVPTAPSAPAPGAATAGSKIPPGSAPRLVVLRGQKRSVEYPLYEGQNFIGRADEKPVDIDLEDQEPPDRVWSSRQHALILYENEGLSIEDLNSSNGTFVNRAKIYPGQPRQLNINDVIQIGTVQLKVVV